MNYIKSAGLILAASASLVAVSQAQQGRPATTPAKPSPGTPAVSALQQVQPATVSATGLSAPQLAPAAPVGIISASTVASHESSAAVDYVSGKLTIVSDSAPLGYVLKLIAKKTGAVIDLAPELQNEPVVARLGPDSVQDVMTGLLDSSRIDYIVFGTGDEPGSLRRIVVRTRHSFGNMAMAAIPARQPSGDEVDGQAQPEQNGHVISRAVSEPTAPLTDEQRMANWKKDREERRVAEMQQQAQDRENEKYQTPQLPAQDNPPQDAAQQDNPPQS